jgi:hypothetical protein
VESLVIDDESQEDLERYICRQVEDGWIEVHTRRTARRPGHEVPPPELTLHQSMNRSRLIGRMIEMGQRVANGDDVLAMSHRQHFRKSGEPRVLLGLRGYPVALFYDYDQFCEQPK